MGAAFVVAIVGIYILVVAQFGSFKLPLVILTPIPLTLIGIVLGHWLFGAPFTATSMIGFIALAGIIVRNSILLVDFIRHGAGQGKTLREVLLEAGAVRFKPILLTALAAMIGAATILRRPDLPGPGDFAAVRSGLVDVADRAGDPGDLRRVARCRRSNSIRKWYAATPKLCCRNVAQLRYAFSTIEPSAIVCVVPDCIRPVPGGSVGNLGERQCKMRKCVRS